MMLNTKRPASLLDITTGLVGVAYNPVVLFVHRKLAARFE